MPSHRLGIVISTYDSAAQWLLTSNLIVSASIRMMSFSYLFRLRAGSR